MPGLLKNNTAQYAAIVLGCAIYGAGMNLFIIPLSLYSGGIMGFCQLANDLVNGLLGQTLQLSGAFYLLVNLPLLILAWHVMGRRFLIKTIMGTLGISAFMSIIPVPAQPLMTDPTAAVLLGGAVSGFGVGMLLVAGGSGGGLDILGMWAIKRFPGFSVGRLSMLVNAVLFTIYLLRFDVSTVLFSLIFTVFQIMVMDRTHYQNINVRMMIFTKQPGVDRRIMEETARGVTEWKGMGAYTGEDMNILVTIISKYEVDSFAEIVRRIDPTAFVIVDEGVRVLSGNFEKRL